MKTYIIDFRWVQFGGYKALHKSDCVTGSVLPQLARYGLEAHENCLTGVFLRKNMECLKNAVKRVDCFQHE